MIETHPHIADLLRRLPTGPGVYQYFDAAGAIIYIGKAKNLKNRVRSYFQVSVDHTPKTTRLLAHIADLRWIETATEMEALTLEANLVKEHQPRFNVLLRDDKHFLYFKVTTNEATPRIVPVRKIEKDGARYFGPKTDSLAVRETIKLLEKLFHAEVCTAHPETDHDVVIDRRKKIHLPCPLFPIGMCTGPMMDEVTQRNYDAYVRTVCTFLAGHTRDVERDITARMQAAAADKRFEYAARLRDQLGMIASLAGQQLASTPDLASRDVIGVRIDGSKAYIAILEVRDGKLIDQKNLIFSADESTRADVLTQFVTQYYPLVTDLPTEILLPEEIEGSDDIASWLSDRAGRRVYVLFPERGAKAGLIGLAEKNAAAFAVQSKARFENASVRTIGAARELADSLGITKELKRVECYDISHLGGTATTASMVVFTHGEPATAMYRHFNIHSLARGEIDDYASMAEVLRRRMSYLTPQLPEGVRIRRATKKEIVSLKIVIETALGWTGGWEESVLYVAVRDDNDVLGCVREYVTPAQKIHIIESVYVAPHARGQRLGHELMRYLVAHSSAKKLYLDCEPHLEEYYTSFGCQVIRTVPPELFDDERELVYLTYIRPAERAIDVSFSSTPDLVILDGGKGQLSAVLKNVKLPKKTHVVGLAKQFEEIWRATAIAEKPEKKGKNKKSVIASEHSERGDPVGIASPDSRRDRNDKLAFAFSAVRLPETSNALHLVTRIRDEAHRFANELRKTVIQHEQFTSALDELAGVGEATQKKLLTTFHSLDGVRAASLDALVAVIGPSLGEKVYAMLH